MSELQKTVNEHLREAAQIGNIALMQDALDNGAEIHHDHDSALQWVCYNGHREAAEFLLDNGADPHADGGKPLKHAAEQGRYSIVLLLLERGAAFSTLSTAMQVKYAGALEESKLAQVEERLKNPYQLFNDHTVLKFEGRIREIGDLHKIFDFSARTVTQMVGKTPATPLLFSQFRDNRDEIMDAYDWLKSQDKNPPAPFTAVQRKVRHNR
ncbi:MAG: ankyrin repeat domain-containing protein [Pseudomonadota bacterium]|nr:ankyrin repeat domain-containing protein [Pseudomonadota bacterium]QKK05488.1 MAG: ankyrin repeat domain-containing protein [Pseudomonadota bacterium]